MEELKLIDNRKSKIIRKPLSEKLRFEILRRDGFTCQYCGKHPENGKELEIDHIIPVSKGGSNEVCNLLTACKECNRGKMAEELIGINTNENFVDGGVYRHEIELAKHKNFLSTNPSFDKILDYVEQEAQNRVKELRGD